MKRKLFPNVRRITTIFTISIFCVTLAALFLRLTVFSDLKALASPVYSAENDPSALEDEPGFFPYSMSRNVYFATPDSRGSFLISNPETNEYFMTVAVILPKTGENLLYTGFIMPGESLNDLALDIPQPEGICECIAEITAYDPDTMRPVGSEQKDITLRVGEKFA
ncbi:MAG: hypothetical protein LBU86_01055 [Oscillospiraceae bacterium]|jgi:hypothetical protein|nr:hypothetical protein [Oscillospiraceae bacterium]